MVFLKLQSDFNPQRKHLQKSALKGAVSSHFKADATWDMGAAGSSFVFHIQEGKAAPPHLDFFFTGQKRKKEKKK